jgi:hypothetical protein
MSDKRRVNYKVNHEIVVKVKLSLYLTKYHAMKMCGEGRIVIKMITYMHDNYILKLFNATYNICCSDVHFVSILFALCHL